MKRRDLFRHSLGIIGTGLTGLLIASGAKKPTIIKAESIKFENIYGNISEEWMQKQIKQSREKASE